MLHDAILIGWINNNNNRSEDKNKMEKNFPLQCQASFIINGLRQLGYTNYTAIADIIDNSIEPDVDAKNVCVNLIKSPDKRSIDKILIVDDGCGMDAAILQAAMSLGADTGKTKENNLGCYGAGLKTAAISIGRHLKVYTKTEDSDLLTAEFDLDNISDNGNLTVNMESYSEGRKEYTFFHDYTKTNHGTIVEISKLDNLANKDYNGFEGTLSKKIRILFNKYIEANIKNFYVNGDKLTYFDIIGDKTGLGTELLAEGTFNYNDSFIKWKAWYVPTNVQDRGDFYNYFPRNAFNAGIYIYRQSRLVGLGLDFNLVNKTYGWVNGFRFELFLDGNADKLFGTTFTKVIMEKDSTSIDQGFYDTLANIVKPLVNQCVKNQKKQNKSVKITDDIKASLNQTLERVNKNILLKSTVNQKGINEKQGEHKEKNPNPKPQQNPNPTKKRVGKYIDGYEFVSDGTSGMMYNFVLRNNKRILSINQDHAFYEKIFKELSEEDRYLIGAYLFCEYSALVNSKVWTSEEAALHIKNYKECYADAVRRFFIE